MKRNLLSHGCICPPGTETTCQGTACPRRPIVVTPAVLPDRIKVLLDVYSSEIERRRAAEARCREAEALCDRYAAALRLIAAAWPAEPPGGLSDAARAEALRQATALRQIIALVLEPTQNVVDDAGVT